MRKLRGAMDFEVLEDEAEAVSAEFVTHEVRYPEVPHHQNPPLKADQPGMIGVVLFKRGGDFVRFLEVERFMRFTRFYEA